MTTTNPLINTLKSRIPGETFKLPSQGLFYLNGELASEVVNGEVHIFPMSTYDEILMKTPDKLFSGQAITEVFSRCVPQILKPMELLSKDVDYILICLRMMSFGDEISLLFTHDCENAKEHTYAIKQRPLLSTAKMIDPTILGTTCNLVTESSQEVKLRPTLFKHLIAMYQVLSLNKAGTDEDLDEIHEKLMDVISGMIVSVDGLEDPKLIREWLSAVPAGWVQTISGQTTSLSEWGVDPLVECICKDCEKPFTMEVPVNPVGFFT